jgi:hypothetical protein
MLKQCSGFHFYVDAAEVKCFTENLVEEQLIEATYKVLIHNAQSNTYVEQAEAMMKVAVYSFEEKGNILDTTLSYKGKFKFTANDNGRYKICMYLFVNKDPND